MFYVLYELTFVALAHSSEVFVNPQLAVGHAEISTGHAESWGRKIAAVDDLSRCKRAEALPESRPRSMEGSCCIMHRHQFLRVQLGILRKGFRFLDEEL